MGTLRRVWMLLINNIGGRFDNSFNDLFLKENENSYLLSFSVF